MYETSSAAAAGGMEAAMPITRIVIRNHDRVFMKVWNMCRHPSIAIITYPRVLFFAITCSPSVPEQMLPK
jgi:hypothetical protein